MVNKGPVPRELIRAFLALPRRAQIAFLAAMNARDLLAWDADFEAWAHAAQLPPKGGWRTWLMMAGRGFGKTRAGAEWIQRLATERGRKVRIALIGATEADVRQVMIEGESGILAIAPARLRPRFEPSLGRLSWPGGSVAHIFSAEAPEALRGHAFDFAWGDEIGKWREPEAAWDNLQLALRRGERPRVLATTTPRSTPFIRGLMAAAQQPGSLTVMTRGQTADNAHHAPAFLAAMLATYGGTRLGAQELEGRLIDDLEGALWPRATIEASRRPPVPREMLRRVVIGVDPPGSQGGAACGIVAAGIDGAGVIHVIGDHSVSSVGPGGWSRAVADAALRHDADLVVAERNNGGDMVAEVLRIDTPWLMVKPVWAGDGKARRAEPVSRRFAQGRATLACSCIDLEEEMAGFTYAGYEGPGKSPDRADAMVWAVSELAAQAGRAEPRIRLL